MFCYTNAGGGGAASSAWAYIGVTYPSGSTCTATNGTITLNAQGTSGSYVFLIPQPISTPETWTVSCTNGSKSKSETVSISTQYQVVLVTLRYSRLPEGYQEVEYLYSPNGNCAINTGLGPQLYTEQIEIDFECPEDIRHHVMGFGYSSTPQSGIVYRSEFADYNTINIWYPGNTGGASSQYIPLDLTIGTIASVVINNSSHNVLVNGVVKNPSPLASGTWEQVYDTMTIALFSFRDWSSTSSYINGGRTKIYKYIRTNLTTGNAVQNLVPCYRIADSVKGMYDIVSGTFFTNVLTGTFEVGPDV